MHRFSTERVREIFRFGVSGLLNTAISYVLFLVLLTSMAYQLAYAIAYVAGIATGYLLACRLVFDRRPTWQGLVAYPLVYVAQYLVSAVSLGFLVDQIGIPVRVAPLIVVLIAFPASFVISRMVVQSADSRQEITSDR